MKVVAVNGSPRVDGNTRKALDIVAKPLRSHGIEVDLVHLGACAPCTGCYACARTRDGCCALPDDGINECVSKIREADGLLIGTPVYYAGMSGALKGALDRVFTLCGNNGALLRHKVGAAVVVARRTGGVAAFDTITHYLTYAEMVVVGGNGWDNIFGQMPGEVCQDPEGVQNLRALGRNMAWLIKSLDQSRAVLPPPEREKRISTNFVR